MGVHVEGIVYNYDPHIVDSMNRHLSGNGLV